MSRLWKCLLVSPLALFGFFCVDLGIRIAIGPHGNGRSPDTLAGLADCMLNCVSLFGMGCIAVACVVAFRT